MWPHSLVVRVGDTAVCVGTDDSDLVTLLEPWRCSAGRELTDLGLQLHPPQPTGRGAPRALANLRRGSDYLASVDDPELLRHALLRILAALEHPVTGSQLRITGTVLENGGHAFVFPNANVQLCAHRELVRRGFAPIYSLSVLVDTDTCEVIIDAPLGSDLSEPTRLPLAGVWLAHRRPDDAMTPPIAVARMLGNLDLTVERSSRAESQATLDSSVRLVDQGWVHPIGHGRDALLSALAQLGSRQAVDPG